jgi:hypothetical protein
MVLLLLTNTAVASSLSSTHTYTIYSQHLPRTKKVLGHKNRSDHHEENSTIDTGIIDNLVGFGNDLG